LSVKWTGFDATTGNEKFGSFLVTGQVV